MDELREKIARQIYWWKCKGVVIDFIEWDELPEHSKQWYRKDADQILALIKEAGYVKLAENQDLPNIDDYNDPLAEEWEIATRVEQDMLKAGFRKVG